MKGRVGVYVPKSLNKYRNFNYLKEIALIEAGQSFGELALLYNSVRSATIIALEPTELIVLNRSTFKKYIHNVQTYQLNQIINFYEHLIMFKDMKKNELISLSSKSIMKKYQSRIYLIKQNEEANCIFFIKSGLVQVIFKLNCYFNSTLFCFFSVMLYQIIIDIKKIFILDHKIIINPIDNPLKNLEIPFLNIIDQANHKYFSNI